MSKTIWVLIALVLWIIFCAWWYCKLTGQCSVKDTMVKEVPAKVVKEAPAAPVAPAPEPEPIPEPAAEVVVEEKEPFVCTDYIDGTLRLDRTANNAAVDAKKLEEFLNEYEGANLAVDSEYGTADEQAVRAFQEKYAAEVLTPLDLTGPTGHVLGFTRAQINKIYCEKKEAEQS